MTSHFYNKILTKKRLSAALITLAGVSACQSAFSKDDNNAGFQLEEVMIKARRVEESLQDSPVAVTAVTGDMLAEKGIQDIAGVADIAPNVSFGFGASSGSDSSAIIFIRGVGQIDFTLVTDPGVGLYVDGVYYSRTVASVLDVFDLERVEVLRGPQGTLFGRNSIGGAISLATRNPEEEFGGSLKLTLGDKGRKEVTGRVDIPVSDTFGLTFSGLSRKRDGSVKDASGRDLGDDDMQGARLKGLWDVNDDFSLMFAADYVSENEGSAAEVPLVRKANGAVDVGATDSDFTPVTASQGESVNDQKASGFTLVADYALNDIFSIKSISAYRELDSMFSRSPASATNFSSVDEYTHSQFSEEFQLIGYTEHVDFVAGLFYMEEDGENAAEIDIGVAPTGWPRIIGVNSVENENYAIFAEATWRLTERMRLITGGRYTKEEKMAEFVSETLPGLTRGTLPSDQPMSALGFSGPQLLDFSKTTWRSILQYDINDYVMGYASASTGFKSGGFQQRYVAPTAEPDSFEPEFVTSYEVGVKAEWETVRLNLAVFTSDYSDLQISGAPAGQISTQTFNGGEARIDGIEVELTWVPTPQLLVDFSLGFLDAKYEKIEGNNTEITLDDELVRTPDYSATLGASYLINLSNEATLKTRLDIVSKGETHFEPNNSIATFEDGYTTVNVNAAYTSPLSDWVLRVGIDNLSNEKYLVAGDANNSLAYDLGVFARPRNYYISTEFKF